MNSEIKYNRLKQILSEIGGVVIGFSGGVDSTFLLKTAVDVLKDRAVGLIAASPVYPDREIQTAVQLGNSIGARIRTIHINLLSDAQYVENPVNRCFFCKHTLYREMMRIAEEEGLPYIADGTNVDDESDYRPGAEAQKYYNVRTPLKEAGLHKEEIRLLSQQVGLSTFNKVSNVCLASRIPYGSEITAEKLRMVEEAERFLQECGFSPVRVRHYGTLARIEVGADKLNAIIHKEMREAIIKKCKEIGFIYVTVDLECFRSGSMNEVLQTKKNTI